jgi:hypothetical protein
MVTAAGIAAGRATGRAAAVRTATTVEPKALIRGDGGGTPLPPRILPEAGADPTW